jgi:hypothetical protein
LLLEYLSPHVGDWAEDIADAVESADPVFEPADINALCDIARPLLALLPQVKQWSVDLMEDINSVRAGDTIRQLAEVADAVPPATADDGAEATLAVDLLTALKRWQMQLNMKPVGRVHRKMDPSPWIKPGDTFELLLYR